MSLPRMSISDGVGVLDATVVGIWDREGLDIEKEDAAPTFRNMARTIFDTIPQSHRVALLCSRGGQLLLIFQAAHQWFDVRGNRVQNAPMVDTQTAPRENTSESNAQTTKEARS